MEYPTFLFTMRVGPKLALITAACAWLSAAAVAVGVTAKSAIVVDAATGRVLWAKDPDTPRFPASTTKVMTALLVLDWCKPDDVITAPFDTESVTGSSLHLRPGEQVTAQELLYAILLRSANDACHAAAIYISGGDAAFARLMNKRAQELGCTRTHFHNPHGLNDPEHTITARDLSVIACEAMTYPLFREVVRCRKHLITRSMNQEDRWLINHDKYLAMDKTADGIKTGFTVPAGHCYVGSATRNGYRVITVLMKSDNWEADNKTLLDWAFKNHERRTVAKAGETLGTAPVQGGAKADVTAVLGEDLQIVEARGDRLAISRKLDPRVGLAAPLKAGQRIGDVVFSDGKGWERRYPLLAGEAVARATLVQRARTGGRPVVILAAGVLAGGYLIRRRALLRGRKPYGYYRVR